jgi:hypothetical protein
LLTTLFCLMILGVMQSDAKGIIWNLNMWLGFKAAVSRVQALKS